MYDDISLHVFVIIKNAKIGFFYKLNLKKKRLKKNYLEQTIKHLDTIPIPFGNTPLTLSKGIVHFNTQNGRLNTILLSTHKTDTKFENKTDLELEDMLQKTLILKRF